MFELKSTFKPIRRAVIIGVCWGGESWEQTKSLLDELGELVDALGVQVVECMMIKSHKPQAHLLVGNGKAAQIIQCAREKGAGVIIFDHPITPAQQRNWEALSNLAVIDREEVILDIFVRRAHTREARLQVELARMEYSLPRLTRAWQHLERQAGTGFGMTGAGETQLETDRRLIRKRIDRLKLELAKVRLQRATRRKSRFRETRGPSIPHAAIVGYTNAGKSSLFRRLTGTHVLVEDKLFATLDTTTRRVDLPRGTSIFLTDTVGFVRKLPHRLVESFKATLEESILADFLIHVLDVTNEAVLEFYDTTMDVLEELGANMKRMIIVFNKIDLQYDPVRRASLQRRFPDAIFVSTRTGEGFEELYGYMKDLFTDRWIRRDLLVPQSRYHLISELHQNASVIAKYYEGDDVRLTVSISPRMLARYEEYIVNGN